MGLKLNIISGGAVPGGPMKGGIPARGGQVPRGSPATGGGRGHRDHRSKKSYTGTVAGLGRSRLPTRTGVGPRGPGAHAFHAVGTALPARSRGTAPSVEFHPAQTKAPSLMTRIGARMRRTAAAFGL